MADLGGLADKAKNLGGDKVENISDAGLEKADDLASEKSGGKFDEKIDVARDAADKKIN